MPFLKINRNNIFLKLHRDLYSKEILERLQKENAEFILSIKEKNKYYFLKLNKFNLQNCFDFLNYLIYLLRSETKTSL